MYEALHDWVYDLGVSGTNWYTWILLEVPALPLPNMLQQVYCSAKAMLQ